jgi:hypothetical protein
MAGNAIAARLAVEYWKLLRAFERALDRVSEEHKAKTAAQARFSAGQLDAIMRDAGLNLATFEGHAFSPNLPVAAINGSDFDGEDDLVIETTVEPAIMDGMNVLAMGKVIVAKRGGEHVSGN